VFIVASISGGSGGGMLFDLAYGVRELLGELGLPSGAVCGMMLHATHNKSAGNDLRKANAYATLTELNYFNHGGGFRAGAAGTSPASNRPSRRSPTLIWSIS